MVNMTIKELTERYNISKQALHKRVKQLSTSCYTIDDNGVYHITPEGVQILDAQLSTKRRSVNGNVDADTIKNLTESLKQMTATIDAQNKEIAELTKLLDQSQKLHMIAEQKLLAIEDKTKPKKHWWQIWNKPNQEAES